MDKIAIAVARRILTVRGQPVMLDSHLADLYGAPTKRLNEQVRRNRERFPDDFMFQLSLEEWESLRSQIATSNAGGRGGRRHLPYVFTEYGALMVANILNSKVAITASIAIVRTFARMKNAVLADRELARRMDKMEHSLMAVNEDHTNTKKQVRLLGDVMRSVITPPEKPKRKIGFRKED
ncbi:MAG: ORF6N domain-containing protein [Nitrospinae bacterium]|nr:ORF6N domain-containing protein [Nitrospinota bacterium]